MWRYSLGMVVGRRQRLPRERLDALDACCAQNLARDALRLSGTLRAQKTRGMPVFGCFLRPCHVMCMCPFIVMSRASLLASLFHVGAFLNRRFVSTASPLLRARVLSDFRWNSFLSRWQPAPLVGPGARWRALPWRGGWCGRPRRPAAAGSVEPPLP